MKSQTPPKGKRTAGTRFSTVDGIAIVACAAITWFAFSTFGKLAWLPAIVLGHFFLFCNVFRIHRNYELIWAGCFIANFGVWVLCSPAHVPLEWILLCQIPITVILILLEMRGPNYHGILANRLNPKLEAYLNAD